MASEFSEQLAKKLDAPAPTFLTSAVVRVIDAELQEVRLVIEALLDVVITEGAESYSRATCQRARALMEKLEVRP
jgi:hypothetical protein